MFNFTPLLGAQSTSPASQSLLEFEGGVKILIDLGWDNGFDVGQLRELERHVSTLSLILLTHATPAHIAAFAHCCKHVPLFTQIPVYATTPVISLGRTLLGDLYGSTALAAAVIPDGSLGEASYGLAGASRSGGRPRILYQPPTSEEIASYFNLINPLKYSQPHQPLPAPFSPPLNGLTVTAYNAGHTLGGTIWHIQHGMESVVYAVDWNQVRENMLSGAAWLGGASAGGAEVIEQLRKPTALVCSTKGVEKVAQTGGRLRRDELLLDMIRSAVGKGGTVLVPTDTSARSLELAYLLDHAWSRDAPDGSLRRATLYLASNTVGTTMRYARSMLEWMDESVVREFENGGAGADGVAHHRKGDGRRNNNVEDHNQPEKAGDRAGGPFDFKHLRFVGRGSKLERILGRDGPKVILASDSSLAWGLSRRVLSRIADGPSNLVILTDEYNFRGPERNDAQSLGRTLWDWYQQRRDGVAVEKGASGEPFELVHMGGREMQIDTPSRTPLQGKELAVYQTFLATQRQLQDTMQSSGATALESSADALDETSSTSSSSSGQSGSERQGKALNFSTTLAQASRAKGASAKETLGVNLLLRQPGVYDYDVRGKKGREVVFPYPTKRRRIDDFGELIRPEDYLRAEERDEVEGQDMRNGAPEKNAALGQKRKWDDPTVSHGNGRRGSLRGGKRQKTDYDPTTATKEANGPDSVSDSSDTEAEEVPVVPSKLTYTTDTVQANLRIAYVDFSGLHDQRSLTMLIPLIRPRKLVLVGGTASETQWLAEECRQKLTARPDGTDGESIGDIFTPVNGQTVSASMDTNAWTVKLSRALVRKFHWQNVRGLGVVTLVGSLAATLPPEEAEGEATRKKRQKKLVKEEAEPAAGEAEDAARSAGPGLPPTLDVVPASMAAATRSVAQPLHVGDLRLADLRKILASTGHTAEFRGEGTLVIDGLVTVRKTAGGRIEVEGGGLKLPPYMAREREGAFHAVKKRIYEGLAVVAGGM